MATKGGPHLNAALEVIYGLPPGSIGKVDPEVLAEIAWAYHTQPLVYTAELRTEHKDDKSAS